jgi:D-amino peptidase
VHYIYGSKRRGEKMKIYISADIEGVTGVTHWDETELAKGECNLFREQMTEEVVAACQGALG